MPNVNVRKLQELLKSHGFNVPINGTVDRATVEATKQYYLKFNQQQASAPRSVGVGGSIIQASAAFCRSAYGRTYSQCGQEISINGTVSNPRFSDCSSMVTASLILARIIIPRKGSLHQWATSHANWQANRNESIQRNTGWPIIWKQPGWENYLAPGDVLWRSGHVQFFAGRLPNGQMLTLNHGSNNSINKSASGPYPMSASELNSFTCAFRPNRQVIA